MVLIREMWVSKIIVLRCFLEDHSCKPPGLNVTLSESCRLLTLSYRWQCDTSQLTTVPEHTRAATYQTMLSRLCLKTFSLGSNHWDMCKGCCFISLWLALVHFGSHPWNISDTRYTYKDYVLLLTTANFAENASIFLSENASSISLSIKFVSRYLHKNSITSLPTQMFSRDTSINAV